MADDRRADPLVTTQWVDHRRGDPSVRLLEVDGAPGVYEQGHIPGAIPIHWATDLSDPVRRDILSREAFEALCRRCGIGADTTLVFYGDDHNGLAAHALWQFRYWGHGEDKLKLMDGGREKWLAEGRDRTTDVPSVPPAGYTATGPDPEVRALKDHIMPRLGAEEVNLVDVRTPDEFTGERIAPPATARRGGRIPGAVNVPWSESLRGDGTFKPAEELRTLYEGRGVDLTKPTIAYGRTGERSSHSWFVLTFLLGQERARSYDGGWAEWGNLVGAPIEKG